MLEGGAYAVGGSRLPMLLVIAILISFSSNMITALSGLRLFSEGCWKHQSPILSRMGSDKVVLQRVRNIRSRKFLSRRDRTFQLFSTGVSFSEESLISSTKGVTVKLFSSLITKKKARIQNQMTVVEGHRLVLDLLQNSSTRSLIEHILVVPDALENAELGPELSKEIDQSSIKINFVTDQVMKSCTDTVTPQGVVATCRIPPEWDPETTSNEGKNKSPLYLILDGVSDPGNMGTLLRSSLAVDVQAVLLLPGCVDVYSPKAVRSAMGSTFRMNIKTMESAEECWSFLRDTCATTSSRIFAATMETDGTRVSQAHGDVDWSSGPSALCIGKEGQGLSRQVREAVATGDISAVHVPMANGLESLNAAVCGSVIMFEHARQVREKAKLE